MSWCAFWCLSVLQSNHWALIVMILDYRFGRKLIWVWIKIVAFAFKPGSDHWVLIVMVLNYRFGRKLIRVWIDIVAFASKSGSERSKNWNIISAFRTCRNSELSIGDIWFIIGSTWFFRFASITFVVSPTQIGEFLQSRFILLIGGDKFLFWCVFWSWIHSCCIFFWFILDLWFISFLWVCHESLINLIKLLALLLHGLDQICQGLKATRRQGPISPTTRSAKQGERHWSKGQHYFTYKKCDEIIII